MLFIPKSLKVCAFKLEFIGNNFAGKPERLIFAPAFGITAGRCAPHVNRGRER